MEFILSNYPHFNSTYLVRVRFSLDLAVCGVYKPHDGVVFNREISENTVVEFHGEAGEIQ